MTEMKRMGDPEAPLSVEEYERVLRFGKPTTLQVHVDAPATTSGETRVWLSREYLQSVQLQEIDPLPEKVEATPDRFVFGAADKPTQITFELEPDQIEVCHDRS
jgi:hypothetical protein